MYRDTSNIEIGTCATIADDKTLFTFPTGKVNEYKLISNKYYLSSSRSATQAYNADTVCYTQAEIALLPSPFDAFTPIFHTMAIATALLLFYFAYRLIIYPFFRKR